MLETLDPIRKLGEGGEGTVWLTWDRALSRWLAVKVVRLEPGARAAGEELRAKLGPAARELLDPAVAPVLATELLDTPDPRFGVTNGLALYIVMPYIHGLPAHELARGPLPTPVVAALFAETVRLLSRLHAQGNAHLDLKPSNLIVEVQGHPWLVDMHSSTVHGSSGCAAPEQARGEGGPAADWYALGRTLAALWTGRYPRNAADPLPELPKPAVSLSGPERLAHQRLAELIEELTRDDPARRPVPTVEEADALARDLGAGDHRRVLADAVASSPFHSKLAEIEQAQTQRLPLAPSEPKPGKGASRPKTMNLALLAFGIIALVSVFRFGWNNYPSKAPPSEPQLAQFPSPKTVDPATLIHALGPADVHAYRHGLWQVTVDEPVKRITLSLLDGPLLFTMEAPKPGDFVKFDLVPNVYVAHIIYDEDHDEEVQMNVHPNKEFRWTTHPYRLSAPLP